MGLSIWQLLIVLVIVVLLFGTKRLKNIGSDLGGAFRGFKNAINEGENDKSPQEDAQDAAIEKKNEGRVIDGEVSEKKEAEKSE